MNKILEDYWILNLKNLEQAQSGRFTSAPVRDPVFIEEWGSSQPIRFLDESMVTAYDSEGKEMEIPKCEKCGNFKCQIIGKEYWAWVCTIGCENGNN